MGGRQQPLLAAIAAKKYFQDHAQLEFANGRETNFD